MLTAGCADEVQRGWMPPGVTDHSEITTRLWTGSWISALLVGALTWGLILWCVVAYRRRGTDTGFPPQLRYHVPLEVMYTVIPFMIVGVLFYYTSRDQAVIENLDDQHDLEIEVVGKQWSWDFNYLDEDVYETGLQVDTGDIPAEEEVPTLYLPVDQSVLLEIEARDVIHSFWVPQFLYKKDMIPGRTNFYQFTPTVTGTYVGKCAEFCGEYHSAMLFTVKVVEQEEFDAEMERLREAGQTGSLPVNLGPSDTDVGEQVEDEIGEDRGGQEDSESEGSESENDGQDG